MPAVHYRSKIFKPRGGWPALLARVTEQPQAMVLDSAAAGPTGRFSAAAFAPVMWLSASGAAANWRRDKAVSKLEGDPFELFGKAERFAREEWPLAAPVSVEGLLPGWCGLLGYDLRVFVEKLAPPKVQGPLFPDLAVGYYPWLAHFDHEKNQCELRLLEGVPGAPESLDVLAAQLTELLASPQPQTRPASISAPVHMISPGQYLDAVKAIKAAISQGEIYQANLTRCVVRYGDIDAPRLYACLREQSPAPFAAFFDCGEGRFILSASPERFLHLRGDLIETRPVKGTRPRGATLEEDEGHRAALLASAKDRAELVMIVDLERNDLGRVCAVGSVRVPELAACRSYAQVHHLEAVVQGRLRPDAGPADYLKATFPGGSITGAPKKRSMEILHELEPVRRGPSMGSIFALGADGRMDSSVLIRTLLVEPGRASYHVGGGIVADSDPAAEYDETLAKARGLIAALEAYARGGAA